MADGEFRVRCAGIKGGRSSGQFTGLMKYRDGWFVLHGTVIQQYVSEEGLVGKTLRTPSFAAAIIMSTHFAVD